MREIEIKIRVKDLSEVESKLKEFGCILSGPINQHDIIYSKNGLKEFESAKEGDVILRIRKQDHNTEFNLKQQKSSEMDNLEYETEISNLEAMDNILKALGWFPEVEVKKVRRKGKLGEYEICLDRVEELGDFIELEKFTDDNADPDEVREELFKVLEKFGLSREDEEVRGYDNQIICLHKKD